jgi:hypothetical protein
MTAETVKLKTSDVLTGTPGQVRKQLEKVSADQVIALQLNHVAPENVRAVAQAVKGLASLVSTVIERRQTQSLERIVTELVPVVPPPPHRLAMARMTAEARKAVLDSGDWLTAAHVAKMAGFSSTNPSAQPNKWKRKGLIFVLRHAGNDYYPAYGLDPRTGYRPFAALAKILKVFGATKDDWGLAYWFASVNSFLGGKRPQDLLATQAERVIAAAEDEVDAIAHG